MSNESRNRKGFTLVELMAVVVVLAILAGVALPKFFDYSQQARIASCKGTLGGVRAGIANYYADQAITATAAYPTLVQLQTTGTVMQEQLPHNPFITETTASNTIVAGVWASPPPVVAGGAGWAYDAAAGKFWCNSDTAGIDENEF